MRSRVARVPSCGLLVAALAVVSVVHAQPDSRVIRVSQNEAAQQTGVHYTTIQGAIDSLEDPVGAPVVILVSPGVYDEEVVLDRANVSIVGAVPGSVIVESDTGVPLTINSTDSSSSSAVVDSLTLRTTASGAAGLKVTAWDESFGARSLVVSNCDIYSSLSAAVDNDDAAGLVIEDSRLRGSGVVVDSDVSTSGVALEIRDSVLTHATTSTGQYAISLSAGGLLVHGSAFKGGTHGTNAVSASGSAFKLLRECALDASCQRAFDDATTNAAIAGCSYDQGVFSQFWGSNTRVLDYEGSTTASVVIGRNAYTEANQTISIGKNASAYTDNSIAIGNGAIAAIGNDGIGIGTDAAAENRAVAIGKSSQATSADAVAIGNAAAATSEGIALGSGASAGDSGVAIGPEAVAGAGALAIGEGAAASHANSAAVGVGATTTASNQIRLGTSSQTVSIPGPLQAAGGATVTGAVSATGKVTGNNIKSGSANNEAYGYGSMQSVSTGSDNTAVGSHALSGVTTGIGNTAVGRTSQYFVTTGTNGTSIGNGALGNATVPALATGVGAFAGYDLVSGWANTALGGWSSFGSSTPERRTVVGHWAVGTANNQVTLGASSDEVHVPGKLRSTGEARFQGVASFDNVTTPTGVTRAGLFAYNGDMYAYDSAGNTQQISSHTNPAEYVPGADTSFDDPSVQLPFSVHHRNQYIGKGAVVDITKALKWIEEQMVADLGEEGRITFVYDLPAAEIASVEDYEADQVEKAIETMPWIEISLGANGELPPEAWEEVAETAWTVVDEPTTVHEIDWTTGRVVAVEKMLPVEREQPTGRTVRRLKEGWRLEKDGTLLRRPTVDDVLGALAPAAGPARSSAPSRPAIEPLPDWVLDRATRN